MGCLLEIAQNSLLPHSSKFIIQIYPVVRSCITFVVDVKSLIGPTKEDVTGGCTSEELHNVCSLANIGVIN
jgi:hypothetical protein